MNTTPINRRCRSTSLLVRLNGLPTVQPVHSTTSTFGSENRSEALPVLLLFLRLDVAPNLSRLRCMRSGPIVVSFRSSEIDRSPRSRCWRIFYLLLRRWLSASFPSWSWRTGSRFYVGRMPQRILHRIVRSPGDGQDRHRASRTAQSAISCCRIIRWVSAARDIDPAPLPTSVTDFSPWLPLDVWWMIAIADFVRLASASRSL